MSRSQPISTTVTLTLTLTVTEDLVEQTARAAFLASKSRGVKPAFWDDPECDRAHHRKVAKAVLRSAGVLP